jgi:beta-glucosidase
MRLKTHGKWLVLAAMASGLPLACGQTNPNGDTSTSSGGGGGGSSSSSSSATTGSTSTGTDTTTSGTGGGASVSWPTVTSEIAKDPAIESAITALLAKMSLEQKVGQMVQAEIKAITPAEVKQYFIGSVLNGGGSWPGNAKGATAQQWLALADAYYQASVDTTAGGVGVPILWGTDAVHGHSNVTGATLFPHNIGLGAMNDPDLIEQIGAATAVEIAATGIDWSFAPTLAVVRDDRWGRSYESYSEDPAIVKAYAGRMVKGLQGDPTKSAELLSDKHVICTAKHFIGDGGTDLGKDQGDNLSSEADLIGIHAQGYLTALASGAQTVMASFNSWHGKKMHGNRELLTDVLKGKFGFDGFVIGDWNGHGQIPACTNDHCATAVNAGVDMIMVPNDWKAFIANTIADVKAGAISQARIDDAVTRILRVKMRLGLLGPKKTKGAPSTRSLAGKQAYLGSADHRTLARTAVRESLVLLKNKGAVLPLKKSMKVLVAGKNADDIGNQSGGWSLSWQGTGNTNADFPGATSIYSGIYQSLAQAKMGGTATLSVDGGAAADTFDAAIVVIGETPYAEGQGDITKFQTLEHALLHPEDLKVLNNIRSKAPKLPIVTVLVSGRPLYVNKELNRSSAFVAAFLPGSEGEGVSDVLFGDADFHGKLSFSWPGADCQTPLNKGDGQKPLFATGFGLTSKDPDMLGDALAETATGHGCAVTDTTGSGTTKDPLPLFVGGANKGDYVLRIGGPSNWSGTDVGDGASLPGKEITVKTVDGKLQGSAKQATWTGTAQLYSQVSAGMPGVDLSPYANSQTSIMFRVKVDDVPHGVVNLSAHCVYPCHADLPLTSTLTPLADGKWHDVSVPLKCLIDNGLDITNVNTPFLLYTEAPMSLSLEDIRWEPGTASKTPDCSIYTATKDVFNQPVLPLYTDKIADGFAFAAFMNNPNQQVDLGNGNMAWVANLLLGTNVAIHKTGLPADMSAYNVPTGALKFDIRVDKYGSPTADVLVKVATSWPTLSDVLLFNEILLSRPTAGQWTSVSIPAQKLIQSENHLMKGNKVDIASVNDMLVLEAVGAAVDVTVDNIRWTK